MATPVKFNQFVEDLGLGVHNLNTDTLKVALSNTAPTAATDAVFGDITEITAGNGYTAGGATVANTAYSETSGTGNLTGDDVTITADGGSIGPFRYVVLYNDTPTTPADPLIQHYDYGSEVTLSDGQPFTVNFGATIATLA